MGFEGALLLDGLTNTSFMFESHLFVACACVCVCACVRVFLKDLYMIQCLEWEKKLNNLIIVCVDMYVSLKFYTLACWKGWFIIFFQTFVKYIVARDWKINVGYSFLSS